MKFSEYLKEHIIPILAVLIATAFSAVFLSVMSVNLYGICFFLLIFAAVLVFVILYDYFMRAAFFNELLRLTEQLDKKYLLSEVLEEPSFFDGKALYEALKISNKAMNDEIATYKNRLDEYREYIEAWVHEIKTPIASGKLTIENNKTPVTQSILSDLDMIDTFVMQALFYSRSNTVEKDYIVKRIRLSDVVSQTLKANAKPLIENKISICNEVGDCVVLSDMKWLIFILSQIVSNCIKYRSDEPLIHFFSKADKNSVSLFIQDNGIGIPTADLPRVFEKGFTGENGRRYSKSTGMGLYLSKKLCKKLGLDIKITSDGKTTAEIVFPKNSMHNI